MCKGTYNQTMQERMHGLFDFVVQNPDRIYFASMTSFSQDHQAEREVRESVAVQQYDNYSLQNTPLCRTAYRLMCKTFNTEEIVKNAFHLNRGNDRRGLIFQYIFKGEMLDRYTKCLFHADLKLAFIGLLDSLIVELVARLDAAKPCLRQWIARQRSFEAVKI